MKKRIGLIGLVVLVLVLLTACSGHGREGSTWKYTYDAGSYYTLSFSNGTMVESYVNIITGEHDTASVSYTVNGNRLTANGETYEWEIKGNTLILSAGGESTVLTRV